MPKELKKLYLLLRKQNLYIQITSLVIVLFFILPTVFLVNIFTLHFPQFVKCCIFVILGLCLGLVILSFIHRKRSNVFKKIVLKQMILLTLFFFCLSLSPMMCLVAQATGISPMFSNLQFPLGTESKAVIALDSQGRLYYATEAYKRIQVYNEQGEFIKGWFAPIIAEQDWDLYIDKQDLIHVTYNQKDYTYTPAGELFSIIEKQKNASETTSDRTVMDNRNNLFQINNVFWRPCITKISQDNKTSIFILEPFDLWLIKAPLPVIIFFLISFFISAILSRVTEKS